ncbi:hypothetical protein [Paenibacillus sp. GXUN7292]|uniref:hypothetical protein n=1 Tax=Paenibacillus sp. GXUN7292 TaxID=3422499 RepID=UPI003D7E66B0
MRRTTLEQAAAKPKVCVVVTEYRHNSHAEMILGRLLGNLGYTPAVQVASLYTDQIAQEDMSRPEAAKHGIPIYDTIMEAVLAPGDELAGVVIIGEHGSYPDNELGQKMYPRRRFIEEVLIALDESGRRVPIFSDKHLAYEQEDANWIYEAINEREIPFMGGSSIPYVPQIPPVSGAELFNMKEILVASFGPIEAYGYHALEVLQSQIERSGADSAKPISIRAVQGQDAWEVLSKGHGLDTLLQAALNTYDKPGLDHLKDHFEAPVLFEIKYNNGIKGFVIQLGEWIQQWSYAVRCENGQILAARMDSGLERPFFHFDQLTNMIEQMILTGKTEVPLERTYQTTTMINAAMRALYSKSTMKL